ncbi:DUF4383 domain-containing protein [Pseudonocardia sp. C8]|uniref:DUF4383 domain-containing protein n=1 Tax=Pseudonocardia sp. C8 TaxID=2762759 RepID=UPI001642E287|nr:DUF4383 domain-containing protein [Pseudonocardia sp. C8]MBC3192310.1 DUF4383 domain-containing protein [Pseudonocardia sp. C8]
MPVQSEHHSHGHARFPWPQLLVLVTALVMVLYGLIGFRYSGMPGTPPGSNELLGAAVDPIRNIVHLAVGVAGMPCAANLVATRVYGWALLVLGGVEALAGLLTGVLAVLPSGPFAFNLGTVLVAVAYAVLGALAALGRVRSDMPYDRLQAGIEGTGRRVIGLRQPREDS